MSHQPRHWAFLTDGANNSKMVQTSGDYLRIGQLPVLIVDDDLDWMEECAFNLRIVDCIPHTAATAEEALVLARQHEISIAIVDYQLPDGNGIGLIEMLVAQAEADGRLLNFIMATGHASLDLAVEAMRVSVSDFLQKPITPQQLQQAIQRIHAQRESRFAMDALVSRLSSMSGDLKRLADLIKTPQQAVLPAGKTIEAVTPDYIRQILQAEAKRCALGGGGVFGDTAWYMLLDLLLAKLEGRNISVSSACIASGAPMSTAMRLINRLVESEILTRMPDKLDGRRDFLVLSAEMERLLLEYLVQSAPSGELVMPNQRHLSVK